jgi:hypothetical protein
VIFLIGKVASVMGGSKRRIGFLCVFDFTQCGDFGATQRVGSGEEGVSSLCLPLAILSLRRGEGSGDGSPENSRSSR